MPHDWKTSDAEELSPTYRFLFKELANCQGGGCHVDIFLPQSNASHASHPVAFAIHGGAFTTGASSDIAFNQVRYLLSKGFIVCSPEYRLTPQVRQREAHEDVLDACRFVHSTLENRLAEQGMNIRIDTARSLALGGSAGGTASLRLAADIEKHNADSSTSKKLPQLRAIVPAYPCTNVATWCCKPKSALNEGLRNESSKVQDTIAQFYEEPVSVSLKNTTDRSHPRMLWVQKAFEYDCLNSFLFDDPPYPHDSSVINLITPNFPPVHILAAEKDRLIPPQQSYDLFDTLKAAGVECKITVFTDADHGFTSGPAVSTWPKDGSFWTQIVEALDFAIGKAS